MNATSGVRLLTILIHIITGYYLSIDMEIHLRVITGSLWFTAQVKSLSVCFLNLRLSIDKNDEQ